MLLAGRGVPDDDVRELPRLVDEPTRGVLEKALELGTVVLALTVPDREQILRAYSPREMRWTLVITLGVALLAFPARAESDSEARTQTIRLISAGGKSRTLVDRTPKGTLSPGDVFTESSTLRNAVPQFGRARGAIVGSDFATFKMVSAKRADVKGTARLPGGTIRIAATLTPQSALFRIVGGTGDFANARGRLELRGLNTRPSSSLNVYHLRFP